MMNDKKTVKEHLSEIQKGGTHLSNHPPRRLGGCHPTLFRPFGPDKKNAWATGPPYLRKKNS